MYILPLQNSASQLEIPALITRCCILLAAGFADYKEFGADGQGVKWLGEARGILNKLQQGGSLKLLGSNKQPMQQNTKSSGLQSYPNHVDRDRHNGPFFTREQRF